MRSGMLMMPSRSLVGTSERRMARIRRASPFPLLISCQEGGRERERETRGERPSGGGRNTQRGPAHRDTHVHLRGAASQQVDEGGVEGHDGLSHVDDLLLPRPEIQGGERERRGGSQPGVLWTGTDWRFQLLCVEHRYPPFKMCCWGQRALHAVCRDYHDAGAMPTSLTDAFLPIIQLECHFLNYLITCTCLFCSFLGHFRVLNAT